MTDAWAPRPEEKGSLVPPNRRPPTAVGVKTPPPPPPHRRITSTTSVFHPIYVVPVLFLGGGALALLFAPWLLVKVAGASIAAIGFVFSAMILWVQSGAAAWWSSREYGRMRKRQRKVGQQARPSA